MTLILAWMALWQWSGPASEHWVYESVPYTEADDEALTLDLYVPSDQAQPVPVVLFIHGGLWAFGDKADYKDYAERLASEGTGAVLVEFRRAEGEGFLNQITDLKNAVRWVRSHAAEYGFDPQRIGLFGSSSGAHLSALAAFSGDGEGLGDDPPGTSSAVQACFLLYGIYDFESALDVNPLWSGVIEFYMDGARDQQPETYSLYSPIAHVDGTEPPTYLMHGDKDRMAPYEQAEALAATLEAVGVPVTLETAEGMGHGFARTRRWTRPTVYRSLRDFFEANL